MNINIAIHIYAIYTASKQGSIFSCEKLMFMEHVRCGSSIYILSSRHLHRIRNSIICVVLQLALYDLTQQPLKSFC